MREMNKFIFGVAVTLILIGLIGGAFYYGKQQGVQKNPQITVTPTAVTLPTETPTPIASPTATVKQKTNFVNPSATIENIEAAITSKNYAALEGFMAPSVSVTLSASECCGILTPAKATAQLSYTTNGKAPWNFKDNNPVAVKLIAADPANFKDNVIGISSNGFAIAFHLNDKFLIDKIFMVSDYKLIAP